MILLAIFITWLLGFVICLIKLIDIAIDCNESDFETIIAIFIISCLSWLLIFAYLYHLIKLKIHE